MRDYWFSKLCFDIQRSQDVLTEYRNDRVQIMDRYRLSPEVREAIEAEDVAFLATLTNPVLLRYFFFHSGMPDALYISKLKAATQEARHG